MSYFPQEVFRQGFDFSRDTPLERHFSVRNATLSTMLGVLVGGAVGTILEAPGAGALSGGAILGGVEFVARRMVYGFHRVWKDDGMIVQSER